MPVKQVSYTRPGSLNEDMPTGLPETFILKADEDAYDKLVQGKPADIFITRNQCQVLKFQSDGTLYPAYPEDMQVVFGTRDETLAAQFIVQHGRLEGTFPKLEEMKNEMFA